MALSGDRAMKKVAFIAVNYNNCYVTINYISNIKNIRNIGKYNVKIIIVDNASEKKDVEILQHALCDIDDVVLLKSPKNLGYFGGINMGIREINYKNYDYIIAGNNDLFFDRDFLNILFSKKYDSQYTVIVPDLITRDGIHQNPQFIVPPGKIRKLGYAFYYLCYPIARIIDVLYSPKRKKNINSRKKKLKKKAEIYMCTGALLLLRSSFFEHCGLLDDSLFLWGEEVLLSHQLFLVGDKMLYDPELRVFHMESISVSKIDTYKKYKLWKKSYKIYHNYYY